MGYMTMTIGIFLFFLNLHFFLISLNFRKNRCEKCKGYLTDITQYKDVYRGGKSGQFYKRFIDYAYVYRVNGKQYSVTGGNQWGKGDLPRTVDIIYQKNHPAFAYIKGMTFPEQPIVAIMLCPLWIMLTICGFLLIIR